MVKKIRGIGLLELMLSLAIIAILLVMAIRYYQSASNSQKVSQALDMFSAGKSAAKNYFTTNHTNITSISQLVDGGYLPGSYISGGSSDHTSPWGTGFEIETATGYITITMGEVPEESCKQVFSRLDGTLSKAAGEAITTPKTIAACKGGSGITVKYSLG